MEKQVQEKAKKKLSNFETNFDKVSSEAFAKASVKPKQKLYVAGPWFDERANKLMQMVKELFRQYDSASAWEPYFPMDHTQESPSLTFVDNVNQISSCEAILALISRKDVGTAFEIGLAKGLGRKIYLLTLDETDYNSVTNIMLAYSTMYRIQLKDLWKFIIGKTSYEDLIQIPDTWENKE